MAATTEGNASWGVQKINVRWDGGVVVDANNSTESMVYQETDEDGSVVGQFEYDSKDMIQVTLNFRADARQPEPGVQIDYDGKRYVITHCQLIESNTAFCKVQIIAERYVKCETINTMRKD